MKQKLIIALKSFDYSLAAAVIILSVFGIFMIYSSTNAAAIPPLIVRDFGNLWERQSLAVITGSVLMLAVAFIDYRFVTKFYLFIFGFMLALLVAVLLIGADDFTTTARWIRIPLPIPGMGAISMQPSEFGKVFMILFLAKLLDVKKDKFNHPLWLMPILAAIAVPVTLIAIQPSLSAAFVILFISLVVLFTGGLYYRTMIAGLALLLPIGVMLWLDLQRADHIFVSHILAPYQLDRIMSMLSPEPDPYQVMQLEGSIRAIGTGGLTGVGFMNNTYVIFGFNDFIFAVVAEQFGFIGGISLLAVIAFIIIKCILIALKAQDLQGRLIAAGVAGMLIFETFVNVGVAVGILPTTGMPFPFLSYGGSMIWSHMIAIGLVINVGLKREKPSLFHDDEE